MGAEPSEASESGGRRAQFHLPRAWQRACGASPGLVRTHSLSGAPPPSSVRTEFYTRVNECFVVRLGPRGKLQADGGGGGHQHEAAAGFGLVHDLVDFG